MLIYVCLLSLGYKILRIEMDGNLRKGKGRFFISVLAKIQQSPAYVSLWYNKEIRAFVVRGTTVGWCLLVNNCLDRVLKAKRWLVYSRRRLKHWFVVRIRKD